MMKFMVLGLAILASTAGQSAETKYDQFDDVVRVAGKPLALHGQGTRKATLFAIEVYHAAFYAPKEAKGLAEILAEPRPLRLDIRYVRGFDLKDTREAWVYQFRESSGRKSDELAEDLEQLVAFQKPIQKGDVHRFDLEPGKTVFYINEDRRGEITGERFQNALLTVFFGKDPPTKELQRGLLAGPKPSALDRLLAESAKASPVSREASTEAPTHAPARGKKVP